MFSKIKVIYKIIRENKTSQFNKEKDELTKSTIHNVNEEVFEWAESTQKEIENLKGLEEYRKNYVGNVSHELKTPIFSIQGYLHTLLDGGLYDSKINDSYLRKALKNVDRLQDIIEDLESISRLESEGSQVDYSKFDIKTLSTEVIEDLQLVAEEKKVNLSFKDGASVNFIVWADREMIRQVLTNLIVNSIKYGIEGGFTRISFYDLEKQILVEVTDNGIGIEEKHLKHLFDRFYRVDPSRNRKIGGSGLGLSIVKHIIEAHKQSLNVRSRVDYGSTFGFTLEKAK